MSRHRELLDLVPVDRSADCRSTRARPRSIARDRARAAPRRVRCGARSSGTAEVRRARAAVRREARDRISGADFCASGRRGCSTRKRRATRRLTSSTRTCRCLKALGVRDARRRVSARRSQSGNRGGRARSRLGIGRTGRASRSSIRARRGRTSDGRRSISRRWRVRWRRATTCDRSCCGDRAKSSSRTTSSPRPTALRPSRRRRRSPISCR